MKYKYLRESYHKDGLVFDSWEINSNDDWNKAKKEIRKYLEIGKTLHYNDEKGVGYFNKKGNKYEATHYRYFNESKETINIESVFQFLRDFYDIGYSYDKVDAFAVKDENGGNN